MDKNRLTEYELTEALAEHIATADVMLPDYYPEIFRVLTLKATPYITKISAKDDKTTLYGNIDFNLFYLTEDGTALCTYQTRQDFQTQFDGAFENSFANVTEEYSLCRTTGKRRATFKTTLKVGLSHFGEKVFETVTPTDIVCRMRRVDYSYPISTFKKLFRITNRIDMPKGAVAPTVSRVILQKGEMKVIKGRGIAKGEIELYLLYLTEDGCPIEQGYPMQFSQIIDAEGCVEGDMGVFTLSAADFQTDCRLDEEAGFCDIELTMCIAGLFYRNKTDSLPIDCFCPKGNVEMTRQELIAKNLAPAVYDSISESYGLEGVEGDICHCFATVKTDSILCENKSIAISGGISLGILWRDTDGVYQFTEKNLSFENNLAANVSAGDSCKGVVMCREVKALPKDNGTELKITLQCVFYPTAKTQGDYITDVAVTKTDMPTPRLCVCFADKGENVWDIAKEYRVSPEKICKLNDLEGEVIAQSTVLLV